MTRRMLPGVVFVLLFISASLSPSLIQHHLTSGLFGPSRDDTPPVWPIPDDPTEARKARLVNTLLPLIQDNNRDLLKKRARALDIMARVQSGDTLSQRDRDWLTRTGKRYRLPETDTFDEDWMTILLRRLDIIPADLALAQAAMESAWGESRFAQEGNNYFGQWCFTEGCGLVPAKRPAGARYEVQQFESPAESVAGYMRNLNSHPRYTELRLMRERARANDAPVSGHELAGGLHGYSAIGDTYIRTLRIVMRANQFDRFDSH